MFSSQKSAIPISSRGSVSRRSIYEVGNPAPADDDGSQIERITGFEPG